MSVTAKNPILSGFYPDPSVCAVGDDYYIVNSSFAYFPGLPIMHSKDLAHWEHIGNAMDRNSQLPLKQDEISRGLFAPTIRYHKGTFYIICTNVTEGGNFVITATDPKGPWSEPHYLPETDGIDPSLFFDEDDRCYFIGTHPNPEGCRYDGDWFIYIQELNIETFEMIGEKKNVWNGAMRGVHWPEGPHLYKIGEYYYILHAEGGTGPEHAISVARSKDVFGPYENNFKNPIFTHRHLGVKYPIQYVGHGDLVQVANGDWYIVMLATRPLKGYTTMGRETFLARVIWENDWPVVNAGLGVMASKMNVDLPEFIPETDERLVPGLAKHYDFTNMDKLDFNFLTLRNPKEDLYKFCDAEGLGIHCSKDSISYLGIRQDSHIFGVTVVLKSNDLYNGAKAGLMLYQNDKYNLRIEYAGANAYAILTKDGVEEKLASVLLPSDHVTLFMDVVGLTASLYIGEGTKLEPLIKGVDISALSTEVAGGFVGCTIGMYAAASENDVPDDKYACFKSFSYAPAKTAE